MILEVPCGWVICLAPYHLQVGPYCWSGGPTMGPFPSALYLLVPLAHPSACTGSLFSLPALLRGLCGRESRNPSGLCVCTCFALLCFSSLALAEEPLLKELNGAKRLVQTDWRSMFSVSEVSVLIQACVQAWVYEHAACVHVLSLQTFPAKQMKSSVTPYPCKHLLILPTTYPCHVLSDPLYLLPQTHTRPHTHCSHYVHTLRHRHTESSHISVLYISGLCSPIPPTASVLPPSAQWSMSWASTGLRGKDPQLVLCSTPKNNSDGQEKHSTKHPNGNPYGCCYCSVKCFPRLGTGDEGSTDDTTLKMRDESRTEVMCVRLNDWISVVTVETWKAQSGKKWGQLLQRCIFRETWSNHRSQITSFVLLSSNIKKCGVLIMGGFGKAWGESLISDHI